MIPGYNHNIKYQDTVFHLQTEDSGIQNPHIITHLFVGGNIIESRKTSYADIVHSERLAEVLVELMQEQHKGMLKDLVSGRFNDRIAERSVNAATLNGPAPLNVEAGAQHRQSLLVPEPAVAKAPSAPTPIVARPGLPPVSVVPVPPPPVLHGQPVRPESPLSSFFGSAPPAEQIIEAETLRKAFESQNEAAVDSIFGEDLISEKSLDEVILSYLAEDIQHG